MTNGTLARTQPRAVERRCRDHQFDGDRYGRRHGRRGQRRADPRQDPGFGLDHGRRHDRCGAGLQLGGLGTAERAVQRSRRHSRRRRARRRCVQAAEPGNCRRAHHRQHHRHHRRPHGLRRQHGQDRRRRSATRRPRRRSRSPARTARRSASSSPPTRWRAAPSATIDNTGAVGATIEADDVNVTASDDGEIIAKGDIKAIAEIENDYGLSIAANVIQSLIESYKFTTKSGSQVLNSGDLVYIGDDYPIESERGKLYRYSGPDGTTVDLSGNITQNASFSEFNSGKAFEIINTLIPESRPAAAPQAWAPWRSSISSRELRSAGHQCRPDAGWQSQHLGSQDRPDRCRPHGARRSHRRHQCQVEVDRRQRGDRDQ